jgi:glucosamine--fructose-6-phosphate aminotransferase (isomerizing)
LRAARSAIERHARDAVDGADLLEKSAPELDKHAQELFGALSAGKLDGQLEASTAIRLGSLLRYATGVVPLESFQLEYGRVGTPALVVDELTSALTRAIEELTRPVDAIKHQAKTVTVGISRSDEELLGEPLIQRVLETGATREHLGYSDLRALAALAPTIASVDGHTRYAISSGGDEITVVGQGGCAVDIPSRTATDPRLRGTKHLVTRERQILVARGSSDDRTFIIVPEVDRGRTIGLVLLHATFRPTLDARIMRSALVGYRNRYDALVDAVSETEPTFREDLLGSLSVATLLTEPVRLLADHWRSAREEV